MKVDPKTGFLLQAKYLPSPHHDERPVNTSIDMIVLHNISLPPGEFGGGYVQSFFCGELDYTQHSYFESLPSLRVAAHLFIDRNGCIYQFVPFHKRAWHAGESCFKGRNQCNDFSIGIEIEGTDDLPYEIIQCQVLGEVISCLMKSYPCITRDRIVGHSDIAPHRKTDPGASFSWVNLDKMLNGLKKIEG